MLRALPVMLLLGVFPLRQLPAQASDVLSQLTVVDVRVRLEGAARGFPGLDGKEIDRDVRERLSAGGLGVTDVASGPGAGQSPVFEVLLLMYSDSARTRRYAFNLTATITEGVMLRRGDPRRVWAQTWNGASTVGIVGIDGAGLLRADVQGLVDRFVSDYQAANKGEPRKGKRKALAPI